MKLPEPWHVTIMGTYMRKEVSKNLVANSQDSFPAFSSTEADDISTDEQVSSNRFFV
jgi:hypothetical protein